MESWWYKHSLNISKPILFLTLFRRWIQSDRVHSMRMVKVALHPSNTWTSYRHKDAVILWTSLSQTKKLWTVLANSTFGNKIFQFNLQIRIYFLRSWQCSTYSTFGNNFYLFNLQIRIHLLLQAMHNLCTKIPSYRVSNQFLEYYVFKKA